MSKLRTVRTVDVTEMGGAGWINKFREHYNYPSNDCYHDWCWDDYLWAVEEDNKEDRVLGDKLIEMGAIAGEDLLIKVWW